MLREEDFVLAEMKYEYLDHTADVQIHSWGDDLKEAFEQAAMGMYGYMTEIEYVEINQVGNIEANEPNLIARKVEITEFDRENFRIKARVVGETFDIAKHPQGTEVKAITYSNMQVHDNENQHEIFVIIDI